MDTVKSDNEEEIDELMNDNDTEFIAPEEIELTDNPANVHVVDEGTTHTKELKTNKKRNKSEENTPIIWKRKVSPHSREICLLEG